MEVGQLYPLTHPQKRVWYNEKIYSNTSINNIGGYAKVKGIIDFKILERAINDFICNNPGIRLRFIETGNEVSQYINELEPYKLEIVDFSMYEDNKKRLEQWIEGQIKKRFNIIQSRLFDFAAVKVSEGETGIFVRMHHIICDGWSAEMAAREILTLYSNYMLEEKQQIIRTCSYLEFIQKETEYLQSEKFIEDRDFWISKFSKEPEFLSQEPDGEILGNRVTFKIHKDVLEKIRSFGHSMNTFFSAITLIYYNKISQQEDLSLGIPIFNRYGLRQKRTFGMFTSTMPFRMQLDNEISFSDFLSCISKEMKEYLKHQKYPYDILIQDLNAESKRIDRLYSIAVNCYNTSFAQKAADLEVDFFDMYGGYQFYNLQIIVKEWGEGADISFDYKRDLYSDESIEDLYKYFINIIEQGYQNKQCKLIDIKLVSDEVINSIVYKFNDTKKDYPKDRTIVQLFEEQVLKTPNKVAVSFENKTLTYDELNKRANKLAHGLIMKGMKQENIVALMVSHSLELFIGIMGALKAGCAYLPIDPNYPRERIEYILEDSKAAILITDAEDQSNVSKFNLEVINLNDERVYSKKIENPTSIAKPHNLAYLIYTSGSTGKPKGTMIEHRGLVNYIWWAKESYVKDQDDVFAVYSSLAFDLTVTSIFTPLISGIEAAVYRDDQKEYVLFRIIKDKKATIVKLTPAHLSLIKDLDNEESSVRRFIVGGEDFKTSLAEKVHESFKGKIEMFNEYGPTETVVGCMIYKYQLGIDTEGSVPIGIPADNVMLYILDKNLLPVAPGQVGELYISGDGVARGYINKPEITKERFIPNPFIDGYRMYKTGDLAFLNKDGVLVYKGREDFQVKIRGFRIELGEIECALERYKGIKSAVVLDVKSKNSNVSLCAFIVIEESIDLDNVNEFLRDNIPEYMVPSNIIIIDDIPLSPNGKVDRNKLPIPDLTASTDLILPQKEIEKNISKVFAEILEVEVVGINDGFYSLGGDSIKAIQAASKLSDINLRVSAGEIIKYQTISKIISYVENISSEVSKYEQGTISGVFDTTPIVSWFSEQAFKEKNYYNQSILIETKKALDKELMEKAFKQVIEHQDSLRLNYEIEKGKLFYNNNHLNDDFTLEYEAIEDGEDIDSHIIKMGIELKSAFDITNDLLIRAKIIEAKNKSLLLVTMHHLVVDGVSWRIFVEQLFIVYNGLTSGIKVRLPEKTASMLEWQRGLLEYCNTLKENKVLIDYWNNQKDNSFCIREDFQFNCQCGCDIVQEKQSLGVDTTQKLLKDANSTYNTEVIDLLVASLYVSLRKLTGSNNIQIDMEGHGRNLDSVDVTKTVGWFTSIFPVKLETNDEDLGSIIKTTKEVMRNIPDKGLSYGVLRYMDKSINNQYIKPEVRFNYLGQFGELNGNGDYQIINEYTGSDSSSKNHITAKVDINCMIINGDLVVEISYCSKEFAKSTITQIIDSFIGNIKTIVNFTCDQEEIYFTPSDFKVADISEDDLDALFQ